MAFCVGAHFAPKVDSLKQEISLWFAEKGIFFSFWKKRLFCPKKYKLLESKSNISPPFFVDALIKIKTRLLVFHSNLHFIHPLLFHLCYDFIHFRRIRRVQHKKRARMSMPRPFIFNLLASTFLAFVHSTHFSSKLTKRQHICIFVMRKVIRNKWADTFGTKASKNYSFSKKKITLVWKDPKRLLRLSHNGLQLIAQ